MEYEFKKNTLDGTFFATFSMGHEVIGRWLLDEVGSEPEGVRALLLECASLTLSQSEWRKMGREFSLLIQNGEVTVLANVLLTDNPELDEQHQQQHLDYYDDELTAICGLEDFQALLQDWLDFICGR
uniref:YacL family protein n=1 Tax=Thaumasiovibrio occultus TaxID=1891184 RepID=UPI000B35F722|nr:YacL family protein [Thaumasiovibrio occultus]